MQLWRYMGSHPPPRARRAWLSVCRGSSIPRDSGASVWQSVPGCQEAEEAEEAQERGNRSSRRLESAAITCNRTRSGLQP